MSRTNDNISVEHLSPDILNECTHLNASAVDYNFFKDTIPDGHNFLVYKDSILIIAKSEKSLGPLLCIFNLNVKKEICKLFHRGNGHNEMLGIDIRLTNNLLIVNDWVKQQLSYFTLDSILKDTNYQVNVVKHSQPVPVVFPLGTDLVYANPKCFSNIKLGINQIPPRYPKLLFAGSPSEMMEFGDSEFFTDNVAGGGNCIIGDKTIVYASPHQSYLEFYHRSNRSLYKRIEGPLNLECDYDIMNMGQLKNIVFKHRIPYSYTNYCCNENYFYVTYIGDYLKYGGKTRELKSYILKFSWDGKFVKSYSTDCYLLSISKGNDEDVFYA